MFEGIKTEAVIFVDGFGGLVVIDHSKTNKHIIQYMKDESVYEVLDGAQNMKQGVYLAKFNFHYESNFPEGGDELVIDEPEYNLISPELNL